MFIFRAVAPRKLNGKFGKSSSQKASAGRGYVSFPWRLIETFASKWTKDCESIEVKLNSNSCADTFILCSRFFEDDAYLLRAEFGEAGHIWAIWMPRIISSF